MRASDDDVLESLRELRAADERRRRSPIGSPERQAAEREVEALAHQIFEASLHTADGAPDEHVPHERDGCEDDGGDDEGQNPLL